MGHFTIDKAYVGYWSALYDIGYDGPLTSVGERLELRGCYDRNDLLIVGRWKAARAIRRLEDNTEQMVVDVTTAAFGAPEPIRHRILTLLSGVRVPMASALLTAWQPALYTVIDVRAVNSLRTAGAMSMSKDLPPYMEYLTTCREVSHRCECDLRTLDRALWCANGLPAAEPG